VKEIGGFLGLELNQGRQFHQSALALNSGRNCLRHIIRKRAIKRMLVPLYTCDAVINTLQAESVEIIPYHIDNGFLPILEGPTNDYLLYTNYFGINSKSIKKLSEIYYKLIIDNSQAFFSRPISNTDTFYSPRKFFGVPDGGYVYSLEHNEETNVETAISFGRFDHLIKRIDLTARDAYSDYQNSEKSIGDEPIKKMSNLTKALLRSINYEGVRSKRLKNFAYLHRTLGRLNEISISLSNDDVPMVYPLLTKSTELRTRLNDHSVYIATYWPEIKGRVPTRSREAYLISNLIPIPIDQRYGKEEMDIILAIAMDTLEK